jgi:hypothetical protein
MARKNKEPVDTYYLVVNEDGSAFTGLKYGTPQWSFDWEEAKPLLLENTTLLKEYYNKTELLQL